MNADAARHKAITEELLKMGNGQNLPTVYKFSDLADATNNFNSDSLLGEGGFGRVYRGRLKSTNQVITENSPCSSFISDV